jgi:plasmid stabilization system protein ParE
MTFEVFYAPEASDDIDRAFEWFAARAPAVAADFVRAIGQAEVHLGRTDPSFTFSSSARWS